MKQSKCEIKDIPISELKQSKYNPRKNLKPGDTEYEKLKNSILNFGYVEPVIWNKRSGNIVGGHQRAKVMQDLGYESITCIVVDLDDLQEKTLNIALNKITGEWDIPLLTDLLKEIDNSDFDVCLTGFEPEELGEMFGEVNPDDLTGDDFDVETEYENINIPFTELGDIWCIGKHRLMCGDSTSQNDVSALIDGNVMDMCFTDPPYNVNYESANTGKIINDNMSDNEFLTFLIAAFKMIVFSLKPGGAFYICHADSEGLNFRKAFADAGFKLSGCCIWKKNALVLGRSPYQWQHEPCLFGWKKGGKHQWYSDRKQTTIWEYDRPKASKDHPTMKPIPLLAYPIMNSSMTNSIVLEPFGGSGSTLIACEQTKRICRTIELDEKFCDVIVKRYIEQVGSTKDVKVVRDGLTYDYDEVKIDEPDSNH